MVLLRWLFSEWCNYRCPYCPQTHDRYALKSAGYTAHAFDNHPIDAWLDAFDRHLSSSRMSLVLTGGESMLDRPNMTKLLNRLSQHDAVECIRIDTNAWWNPSQFVDLDKSKIVLMCTYHPSQVSEARFFERVASYLTAGYDIGLVNYVMDRANVSRFEELRRKFESMGLLLHPNPLWNSSGAYSETDLQLMQAVLPSLDFDLRSGSENPYGKACLFPALAYEMDSAGKISVGCFPQLSGSFFDDFLPSRMKGYSSCPHNSCVCLDKYSFLEGTGRNRTASPLAEYRDLLKAKARELV